MRHSKLIFFLVVLSLIAFSCEPDIAPEKKEEPAVAAQEISDTTTFKNDIYGYSNMVGAVGVFDVPEMLALSIIDSAVSKDVAAAMGENYGVLEEELKATGAELNGPVGMITYNNDVSNFKFENILLIRRLPSVQPKRCKIVVLEASKMLVFNYYGSYQNLYLAYDKIKAFCMQNNLEQSGPLREFYITDPEKEKDPEKWLTRIMLPVIAGAKK